MEGRILGGRYELLHIVGEGGMGTVYKARCRILDRIVAVKILKEEFADNASFVEKFRTEAMAAARITHPNIVNVYDVGRDNGIYYIVMEYVEGQTLKEYIASQGVVPLATAINITVMICDGVQFAHENQVIHRDLKPQNILITNQGSVKVADFGIARANTTATITFNKDQVIGSVHYISPEQARGAGVSYATDIYSIGCILYEMCTGQMPFDAESPVTVALKHIHDEPIPPADLNPAISPELEDIILHAMMKLPDRRFHSVEEMGKELLRVAAGMKKQSYHPYNEVNPEPTQEEVVNEKIVAAQEVKQDLGTNHHSRKKKMRPAAKIIIGVAVLAFVAGMVSAFGGNFFGKEVQVPVLVGETLTDAQNKAEESGLKLNIISRQPDDEYDVDMIINQDPEAGSNVKEGREIKVIVSSGLEDGVESVLLEDMEGMSQTAAETYLREAGLLVEIEQTYDQKYAEGVVISQTPHAGNQVAKGTTVVLMVSMGAEADRVRVPDCLGSTQQEAEAKLTEAGLTLGSVSYRESDASEVGRVVEQSIQANTMIAEGTAIGITLGQEAQEETPVETEQPVESTEEPVTAPEETPDTTETAPEETTTPSPVTEEEQPADSTTEPETEVLRNKAVSIQLPSDKTSYSVSVEVTDAHGQRNVYQQTLAGGVSVTLNISYYGSGTYQVYLDGNPSSSGTL